jgi:hypothetical protein
MKIDNLSELSKLLDLLNKKGVTACSVDNLTLTLSGEQRVSNYKRKQSETESAFGEETVEWDALSPEEQLFYSSGAIQTGPKAD